MQDFIDANLDSELIDAYTAFYVSESMETYFEESSEFVGEKPSLMQKVYYNTKEFIINQKAKRYELLINEISKDLALVDADTTEFITSVEKNNLIRKVHTLKAEIIKTKKNAESVGLDDLVELLEDREAYADALVDKITKRSIRQERKGISFHLEKDMTDVLRGNSGYSRTNSDDDYE